MSAISNFFLRAKPAFLFPVVVLLPFFAFFLAPAHPSSHRFRTGILLFLSALAYVLPLIAWLGSMGAFFQSITSPRLRLHPAFFYFSLLYPSVYIPAFFVVVFSSGAPGPGLYLIPLHLAGMICMFYLIYFVSRSLAVAEKERSVGFYDYAGGFFLLWFYSIGIFVIQPRVNELFERHS